ncbi:Transmembrane protein 165-like protein, partial [Dinothrombium tinctorium]
MVTTIVSRDIAFYLSIVLFTFFGAQMLIEGYSMTLNEELSEKLQIEDELKKSMIDVNSTKLLSKFQQKANKYVSLVFIEAFATTVFAEWGDRSQISTVVLASRENSFGVFLGAVSGQCVCNAIAVIGGRYVGILSASSSS